MIRLFDLIFSLIGILLLSPFLLIISLIVILQSGWPAFYLQERVGRNGKLFKLIKFRSMRTDSSAKGLLTVGNRDPRVTHIGFYLRKYKLDELPQLLNVLKGEMSFVGPRPEVKKYVDLYTAEQRKVLSVRPGITDHASLAYINENEILAASSDPEKTYVEEVMQDKLRINLEYLSHRTVLTDLGVILRTIGRILGIS